MRWSPRDGAQVGPQLRGGSCWGVPAITCPHNKAQPDPVLTGGAVTDFDGDGMLDLILSHGESMAQPISIFKGTQVSRAGAPRTVPLPCPLSRLTPCPSNPGRALPTTGCVSSPAPASGPSRGGPRWCCSRGAAAPTCASSTAARGTCARWSPWHTSGWVSWRGVRGIKPHQHPQAVASSAAPAPRDQLWERGEDFPLHPHPRGAPLTGCPPAGRDEASSLEVTWPDGRILVRAVASSETNSVLEVPYPPDTEEPLVPTPLEVRAGCGAQGGF